MTIASRLASTALLALLSVAMAVPSCATAGPIAVKCGLQDIAIAASDYAEIAADVRAKDWTDLAKEGEKIGWATLDCVLGDQVAKDGSIKANVDEFRRLKSVEFRAAGVSASNDSLRGGPAAGQEPHKLYQLSSTLSPATRAGSTPAGWPTLGSKRAVRIREVALGAPGPITLASCDSACGAPLTGLVTSSGCSCWRESKTDWRASRWVAAR